MCDESIREPNAAECSVIRRRIATPPEISVARLCALLGILIAWGGAAFLFIQFRIYAHLQVPLLIVISFYGAGTLGLLHTFYHLQSQWRIHRRVRNKEFAALRATLSEQLVLVLHVEATAVIELFPLDEDAWGVCYLFDIGQGQTLVLSGENYLPVDDDMPWPAADFEVVWTKDGTTPIGVFSRGKELRRSYALLLEDADPATWTPRRQILPVTPDLLAREFVGIQAGAGALDFSRIPF